VPDCVGNSKVRRAGINGCLGSILLPIVTGDNVYETTNFKELRKRDADSKRKADPGVTIDVDIHSHIYRCRVESVYGSSGATFSPLPEDDPGIFVKVLQNSSWKTVHSRSENINHLLNHRLKLSMSDEPKGRPR
jgi:hypothetical protein